MATALIVIFYFGLVITCIVMLGVLRAADWAREDAAQKARTEMSSNNVSVVSPAPVAPFNGALASRNRP